MQKKIVVTVALATVLGLAGWQYAQAGPYGPGGGPCWQQGGQGQAGLDEAGQKKLDQFLADTKDLRKTMVVKRAEKMALMQAEKPDAGRIAALAGELFELRNQLHTKAAEAGVGHGWMAMAGMGHRGCGQNDCSGPRHGWGRGMGY
ncbi:MAG: hypothetical protein BWK76_27435 [Desulfobulbaceae bacterium A2]|nr:MAG: hypothetical protein BWK76_27435 [Desulfobulbaceae bacterium A2]